MVELNWGFDTFIIFLWCFSACQKVSKPISVSKCKYGEDSILIRNDPLKFLVDVGGYSCLLAEENRKYCKEDVKFKIK